MADLQQLLQLSQQMQARLDQLDSDLVRRTFEATAGAGLVRATVDGRGTLRALHIDPAAFDGRDAELLADLVLSAVAEAQRRAADQLRADARTVPGLPMMGQP